jgi:DNA-binding response OmpR family regulator
VTLRLLLVEDDAMLGAAIRFGLSQDQFVVAWVQDGLAAETALECRSYCAVVLDLGPPGKRAERENTTIALPFSWG